MKFSKLVLICLVLAIGFSVAAPAKGFVRPSWLKEMIVTFEKDSRQGVASVTQFFYKGRVVYYVPPQCCDVPSRLFDRKGVQICSPDGGFIGTGDGKCKDFFQKRTSLKVIWTRKK